MTDSRAKGKRGEREAAAAMREHLGVEARRGQQFAGGADSPDVRHSIPGVHVEVKRVEALNLWKAMEQAKSESRVTDVPVVLSKRNRGEWLLTLRLEDVKDFCGAMDAAWKPEEEREDG